MLFNVPPPSSQQLNLFHRADFKQSGKILAEWHVVWKLFIQLLSHSLQDNQGRHTPRRILAPHPSSAYPNQHPRGDTLLAGRRDALCAVVSSWCGNPLGHRTADTKRRCQPWKCSQAGDEEVPGMVSYEQDKAGLTFFYLVCFLTMNLKKSSRVTI